MQAKDLVQFSSLYLAFRQQLLNFILFCRRIEFRCVFLGFYSIGDCLICLTMRGRL